MLTQALLQELLHYNPYTGVFTWLERDRRHFESNHRWAAWNSMCAGKKAGSKNGRGYLSISIFKKLYKSHRLAFVYMTGEFPPEHTDHINRVTDDNRWVNLRAVSNSENQKNARLKSNNTSGVNGVIWHKVEKKWRAVIALNRKGKHLGSFTDKFEAICARKSAERKYGYHPNHGRKAVKNSTK